MVVGCQRIKALRPIGKNFYTFDAGCVLRCRSEDCLHFVAVPGQGKGGKAHCEYCYKRDSDGCICQAPILSLHKLFSPHYCIVVSCCFGLPGDPRPLFHSRRAELLLTLWFW